MRLRLTATQCSKARPGAKDRWLNDGNGLYLRVRATGGKSWIIRRKVDGKPTVITLGEYDAESFGLEDARKRAGSKISTQTLGDLIDKYLAEIVRPKHKRAGLAEGYLRRVRPRIGSWRARQVTRADLVAVIQDYRKRGARSADQLRSTLRQMCAYAVELGWMERNPLQDVTRRVSGYEAVARSRVLTDGEIRLLWAEESANAALLRFLLLTGLRIGEAQKGHAAGDRWIVPGEVSKNGKPHWVYLPKQAKAQLPLPECSPTNVQAWLRRWCARHGIDPAFTPHDLRRTAATRMQDPRLGSNKVQPFIVERVLNHTLEGVMAVYNHAEYAEERIDAAKKLERVMLAIVAESRGGRKVAPARRGGRA